MRDAWSVWLYDAPRGESAPVRIHRPIDAGDEPMGELWTITEHEAGEQAPPSLRLPSEVLRLLVAEASDVLPPNAAVDRHLGDTRQVRDRLLDLVEQLVQPRVQLEPRTPSAPGPRPVP